jgi:hypothetical protein
VSVGEVSNTCEPEEGDAIKYAYQHDVIVVSATGNEGGAVSSPANCPGALAIGGTDRNFQPWSKSNSGPEVAFTGAAADTVQESLNGTQLLHGSGTSDASAIVSGTFALLRAHFPKMSARDVITHALHTVHNGLGKFGVRIDDKRGYGEILPYFAMTYPVAKNASNPIYDAWEKELGPASTDGTGSDSDGGGSGASSSSAPGGSGPHGITVARGPNDDSGSSSSVGLIAGIGGGAVLVIIVGLILARARSRRAAHATYPPAGYPPSGPPPR